MLGADDEVAGATAGRELKVRTRSARKLNRNGKNFIEANIQNVVPSRVRVSDPSEQSYGLAGTTALA